MREAYAYSLSSDVQKYEGPRGSASLHRGYINNVRVWRRSGVTKGPWLTKHEFDRYSWEKR